MYDFIDEDGGKVTIKNKLTLDALVITGRIIASTPIKLTEEINFVPACVHPATKISYFETALPLPIEITPSDRMASRAVTLVSAARAMKPVIDFLTARKLEGGNVGMRLEPPPEPDSHVSGRLICARLRPGFGPIEEYAISVTLEGKVSIFFPAVGNAGHGWSAFMAPADLALAIMDAEIRASPALVPERSVA